MTVTLVAGLGREIDRSDLSARVHSEGHRCAQGATDSKAAEARSTVAALPSARARSLAASRVTEEVITCPPASSTLTAAMASPRTIDATVPAS